MSETNNKLEIKKLSKRFGEKILFENLSLTVDGPAVLNGFVESLQSSSATLTVALYVYASERGETAVAFAIATILMVLTFIINFAANLAAKKLKKV